MLSKLMVPAVLVVAVHGDNFWTKRRKQRLSRQRKRLIDESRIQEDVRKKIHALFDTQLEQEKHAAEHEPALANAESSRAMMPPSASQIFVSTPEGEKLPIEMGAAATIGDLRREVASMTQTGERSVSLSFAGTELDPEEDAMSLADAGVSKESVLFFTRKDIPYITVTFLAEFPGDVFGPENVCHFKLNLNKNGDREDMRYLSSQISDAIDQGEEN